MFLGTQPLRLDEKGRLFLPAKWRGQLGEGLVITKGRQRCLYVFPTEEFARIGDTLRESQAAAQNLRNDVRIFFASAQSELPDRQGRVVIAGALRDYAGLDRDCVAVGANARAEIWDAAAWQAYLAEAEPSFAELAGEVLPGLL